MKVLLLNGSPRKGGNTYTALNEVAKQLNANGLETEIFWIGNKPVRGCAACGTCFKRGDGKCVFNDDLTNEISAKVAEADGLVIGSPVYYGMPNGTVLNIVQRMLYSNPATHGTPVANIAICRRGGATSAFQALNMPWMMVDSPIVTSQYWNIAYGRREGDAAFDAEGMQTMRRLADNMAYLLRSLDPSRRPAREPWSPTHFVRDDLKR